MRLFPSTPPPGPFRREFWSSPIRGPWLTSIVGTILLVGVVIVALTGFLSHVAYQPDLRGNALLPLDRDFQPFAIGWPTSPSWLYALTQGLHVTVGFATIPLLLAKLWSVFPRLFAWPPFESAAQAIERAAIGLLVGSSIFEFATGTFNTQLYYLFRFNFVKAHYYGACLFVVSLAVHLAVKAPTILRAYRTRGLLLSKLPEVSDSELVASAPEEGTITRRGLLLFAGGGAALMATMVGGQALGGPFRSLSLLATRRSRGDGDFQINKTARVAGVSPQLMGADWRLTVSGGGRTVTLSREQLLALDLHTETLPIACVEGWSTMQHWTGVRLKDLAALCGIDSPQGVFIDSLQAHGAFRQVSLSRRQTQDDRALLALRVNGRDLSPDHGYPARIIVPALPGVHNTKWVKALSFSDGDLAVFPTKGLA